MDKFTIKGGKKLSGTIHVSGSKNGALPVMAAALLADGVTTLKNIPYLRDIQTFSNVLRVLGASVDGGPRILRIDARKCNHFEAPYDLVKTMRASFYVLGPLLARYGKVRVSLPGGCAWGPRPVDLHLKGLEALGADIKVTHGYVEASAKRLSGGTFEFEKVSVGATANLLMAASLAKGTSRLINTAREPEITFLIDTLRKMGASIKLVKDGIEVKGVSKLKPVTTTVIPDRIEAGTYIAAGIIAGGKLTIENAPIDDISSAIAVFGKTGAKITVQKNKVIVEAPKVIKALDISTAPFPGFATDLQAQIMAVLSVAKGTSVVTDTIYHDRFSHVAELRRLGADIRLEGNAATITGVKNLSGAQVMATDLRASAALVVAGLRAKGETAISRVYHIDRGYEKIEEKLKSVGADIKREREEMVV
ncbi:MAG: UDP-N-acetylglucosamine 1-carboxyvinyltransferase [Fibrobacteres bacterium]|nr:UDP-N-acetylglucosamine 1-carboxyvinyltransferase [Fibrobacterota bacterium]